MPPTSEITDGVATFALPGMVNPFAELSASARLEELGKGRRGAVLARIDDADGGVPLVRTTTRYGSPAQRFQPVHERLAQEIRELAALPASLNNALIEIYTNAYSTMGGHSDQALDLADDSSIAVFSCYQYPNVAAPRKLIFESKEPGGKEFEIPLTHNAVVVFSVAANRRLKHKIVLNKPARAVDNQWLGLTFRTAKTLVQFRGGHAYLPDGARLTTADEEQEREFYQLRRRENNEMDFAYPPLTYTISDSDLMSPVLGR